MLTDRASVKRAVYRLTNTSDVDSAQIENDSSAKEGIYEAIEEGLNDAQIYLMASGRWDFWLTRGAALTFTGSDADPDGVYATLPSDFLRLAGDENLSALYQPTNVGLTARRFWGRFMDGRLGRRWRGNGYWLEGDRLRLARGANPPVGLVMDYIHRPATPADGTDIDFPKDDRPLVAAFAAIHAMENSWLPGGPEMEAKLLRNLERRKFFAWKRARRARQPQKYRASQHTGTHFLFRND